MKGAAMTNAGGTKSRYATWHRVILVGCLVIALLGTLSVIGAMVKVSGAVTEYGGSLGASFYIALLMGLLSIWLFAGSGALLVYIAKNNSDMKEILEASLSTGKD